jgi:uncharacterized protein with NRDE domain
MCLLVLAHGCRSDYPLIVVANRDEFHERPAEAAHWWPERNVLGGRDRRAGGSWFVVDERGRFAAVTNFRDPSGADGERSRGELPLQALAGASNAGLEALASNDARYAPFNLIAGEVGHVSYVSNRCPPCAELPRGIHGLSNGCLNAPWPKVHRGRAAVGSVVQSPDEPMPAVLLDALYDHHQPDDELLPDTGVGVERERLLSAPFIVSPDYGTRSTTVLMVSASGTAIFSERCYDADGQRVSAHEERFDLVPAVTATDDA